MRVLAHPPKPRKVLESGADTGIGEAGDIRPGHLGDDRRIVVDGPAAAAGQESEGGIRF